MPQLRKNPVTREWVIIAAERAKRPSDFSHDEEDPGVRPAWVEGCPFCPGSETLTPPAVLTYRNGEDDANANGGGWWVRAVPNKYPALAIEGGLDKVGVGMYDQMNGVGAHEVIIECPQHNLTIETMSHEQVVDVIWAYRDRYVDLKRDQRFEYIMFFRNHGKRAGASLEHPHSQLVATPMVPIQVLHEMEGCQRYYEFRDRCAYCDMIRQELDDGVRMLAENDHFVAFEPFASKYPYETWILPKRHAAAFVSMTAAEVECLAAMLRDVLGKLSRCLASPPYNYTVFTAPCKLDDSTSMTHHWHVKIMPRLSIAAGFEMGTGIYINVAAPEDAAAYLRAADQQTVSAPIAAAAAGS